MAMKGNDTRIRCSFCGKTEDQVNKLIVMSKQQLYL